MSEMETITDEAVDFVEQPNAAESEKLILGSLLLDPSRFKEVNRHLIAPDFYVHSHCMMFASMESLNHQKVQFDPVLLFQSMQKNNPQFAPKSVSEMLEITHGLPQGFDLAPHIENVKRTYLERRRLRVLDDARRLTESGSTDKEHLARLFKQLNELNEQLTAKKYEDFKNLFIAKAASSWLEQASKRPIAKMLFGEFWHEGELCILFSDTNMGKSILAVQLGDSISRGQSQGSFKLQVPPQKVLYLDFELSDKQFEARYSIGINPNEVSVTADVYHTNHYQFNANFLRAELAPDTEVPEGFKTFEDYLSHSLEQLVVETQATVLIVDNITYLRGETEKAQDALPLMKHLKALKSNTRLKRFVRIIVQ